LNTTTFVLSHLGFAHSFSKYGAWNESKRNIDSFFRVIVTFVHLGETFICFPKKKKTWEKQKEH
jgi:hypothetical protein